MEVLLELQAYIRLVVPEVPPANEWTLMAKCVERIRPIATATEEIESDKATLLTVSRSVVFGLCVFCFDGFDVSFSQPLAPPDQTLGEPGRVHHVS